MNENIKGLDELDRAINDMVRKLDGNATEQAVSAAGEVIFKELEARAPVRSGLLKASLRTGHYKNPGDKSHKYVSSIVVSNSKRFGIMHYAIFLEFGTSKMQRKSFMRPAFDVSQQKAVNAFVKALTAELEK